jgi:hypothetical protein
METNPPTYPIKNLQMKISMLKLEPELLLKRKEESHDTRYSPSVGAMKVKWPFGSSKMKQPL